MRLNSLNLVVAVRLDLLLSTERISFKLSHVTSPEKPESSQPRVTHFHAPTTEVMDKANGSL